MVEENAKSTLWHWREHQVWCSGIAELSLWMSLWPSLERVCGLPIPWLIRNPGKCMGRTSYSKGSPISAQLGPLSGSWHRCHMMSPLSGPQPDCISGLQTYHGMLQGDPGIWLFWNLEHWPLFLPNLGYFYTFKTEKSDYSFFLGKLAFPPYSSMLNVSWVLTLSSWSRGTISRVLNITHTIMLRARTLWQWHAKTDENNNKIPAPLYLQQSSHCRDESNMVNMPRTVEDAAANKAKVILGTINRSITSQTKVVMFVLP